MPTPSFNVTSFTGLVLFVQLTFSNISLLSESFLEKIDTVTFTFNDTKIFVSNDFEISADQSWSLQTKVPIINLGSYNTVQQALATLSSSATNSFSTFMTVNFIVNVVMSLSLQQIWGTLNILQLVLHTPLIKI